MECFHRDAIFSITRCHAKIQCYVVMLPYYPSDGVKLQYNESGNVGIVRCVNNDITLTLTEDAFIRKLFYLTLLVHKGIHDVV